jgi:hypothetical protein
VEYFRATWCIISVVKMLSFNNMRFRETGYYLHIRSSSVSGSRVGEGCCRIYVAQIPVMRYNLYLGRPNKYRYMNKTSKWCRPSPWWSTHTLRKCQPTYAHNKITDFPLSIFTKFTNNLQISYIEFQPICQ